MVLISSNIIISHFSFKYIYILHHHICI